MKRDEALSAKIESADRAVFSDAKFLPLVFVIGILSYSLVQYRIAPDFFSALTVLDNDDAMRLVSVRDYLSGQGWYDNTQYRALPPNGVSLHWSRLVDLPLAGLVLFFSLFSNSLLAESLAAATWPALLFVIFLSLTGMASRAFFGNSAACFAMIAASAMPMINANFFPIGRVDHHNVQIVLMLSICILLIERNNPSFSGALAGGLAALSLAVGLETIVFVAVAGLILTSQFIIGLSGSNRKLLSFGFSLGIVAPIFYALQTSPEQFGTVACDQLSGPVLSITSAAAVFVGAIALLDRFMATKWQRLGLAFLFGLIALWAAFAFFEPCIGGPYDDLPEAARLVVGNIFEAMPALQLLSLTPGKTIDVLLPLFAVCAMTAVLLYGKLSHATDKGDLHALSTILAFLCLGVLASLWQIRAFTWGLALVPMAFGITISAAINANWHFLRRTKPFVMTILTVIILVPQLGTIGGKAAIAAMSEPDKSQRGSVVDSDRACNSRAQILTLNNLSDAVIMAPLNMGPRILLHTSHSVTAVPYHRSAEALSNGVLPFIGEFEEMARRAQKYHAEIVLVCNTQRYGGEESAGERLVSGDIPSWLEKIDIGAAAFTVLRVVRSEKGDLR
jgi:hypothetical protein